MSENRIDYRRIIESEPIIREAVTIAQANAQGKNYWLIGGAVYKLINKSLYGTKVNGILKENSDVDFLFESLKPELATRNFDLSKSSFGEPRLKRGKLQIDLVSLGNSTYIRKHGLKPTIESYLEGCFTNVQSIAFNLVTNELVGQGIAALRSRRIEVTNIVELECYCKMKGITPKFYLDKLSHSLDMNIE